MSEAIQQVDMKSAAAKLAEKIQSAFLELLTPEQWKAMIEQELQRFCQPGRDNRGDAVESVLTKACREAFLEMAKVQIKAVLEGPEFKQAWGNDGLGNWRNTVSAYISQWLIEHQESLVAMALRQIIGGVAQQVFIDMAQRMGRSY